MLSRVRAILSREWIPYLILCLIVVVLFAQALKFGYFVFDDSTYIRENPKVHPLSFHSLAWIWSYSLMPVPYTAWAILAAIFGVDRAAVFHALNIVLHAANCCWVYLWIKKAVPILSEGLNPSSLKIGAFLGALAFAIHPIQVETVVWISSAKELWAFFFGVLSFSAYFDLRTAKSENGIKAIIPYLFLVLSCLSQAGAAALILVFLWLDIARFRRDSRELLTEYSAISVIAAMIIWLYYRMVPASGIAYIPKLGLRLLYSAHAIGFYFSKLFFSFDNHFDYGLSPVSLTKIYLDNPFSNYPLAGLSLMFLFFILLMYFVRPLRILHYALGLIVILILPFTGIFPFIHQNISTVADRYVYFSSLGLSLLVAISYLAILKNPIPAWRMLGAAGVLGMFLVALFINTILLVPKWRSSVTYLNYSVERAPLSVVSRLGLFTAYRIEGRLTEAVTEYGHMMKLGMADDLPYFQPSLSARISSGYQLRPLSSEPQPRKGPGPIRH